MQQTRRCPTRVRRQRLPPRERVCEVPVHSDRSRFREFSAWQMVRRESNNCRLRPPYKLSLFVPRRHVDDAVATAHR